MGDLTVESKHLYPDKCSLSVGMLRLRTSSASRCSFFAQHDIFYFLTSLPDSAGVGSYHPLSRFTAEGLLELRHVRQHIVDAV